MTKYSKKLLQYIYHKLNKYSIPKTTHRLIENTKNRTQTYFHNAVTNSTILKELKIVTSSPIKPVPEKLIHWWQWYQHLIGLNHVEKLREEVLSLQSKITKSREMRHALRQEAFKINNRSKELYEELLRTKRDDLNYVNLTILENKTLQEQSKNNELLNLIEKEEKNYFIDLTTAFNQYQDAQSLYALKYKYLSIFASIVVALISFISSSIYHTQRLNEMKQGFLEIQEKSETNIKNYFEKYLGKNSSNTSDQENSGWLNYTKNTAYTIGKYVVLKGIIW